jgi:Flp pilus assembly protein TadD
MANRAARKRKGCGRIEQERTSDPLAAPRQSLPCSPSLSEICLMREPITPSAGPAAEIVRSIETAIGASDYQRAAELADFATGRGLVHPIVSIARALWLERQDQDDAALAFFRAASSQSPRDARLPNAIGLCLVRLGRLGEALAAFEEAIRLEPSATAYQRKGWVLGLAGRVDEAERAYERALKLAPGNVETLTSLASLATRKGSAERAHKFAERALLLDSRNPGAHIALAMVEIGARKYQQAVDRLRAIMSNTSLVGHERSVALGLLGDALDGANAAPEAFAAYAAANAERQSLHKDRFHGRRRAGEILDELITAIAETPDERRHVSQPAAKTDNRPVRHVFLLGFPRSGTTVLEQALENNRAIATLDERDFLSDLAELYLTSAAGAEALSQLDEAELANHRAVYWRHVQTAGVKLAGRVFVDKHPFHTIKLPLIAKLFPDAGVLFAIRDPRDVVLSCFRRQLEVDLLRVEFLTLEGAVGMYDRFMRLADLCREKLSLPFFDCRYEDLIADFDTTTQGVCGWLGVPWHESMRDIAATANRLDANRASTGQVRCGLYRDGVGQWRRYRDELDSVLPCLQPWILRFGYQRS